MSFPLYRNTGSTNLLASGVVGTSGIRTLVYVVVTRSTSGGATVVNLHNGTSSAGTVYTKETGITSLSVSSSYVVGAIFPAGCFVEFDANTANVVVQYAQ